MEVVKKIRIFLKLLLIIGAIAFNPFRALAGNVESPAAPGDPGSGMYTIDDIYNRLNSGAAGSKRAGGFTEPAAVPGDSATPTLDDLMSISPAGDNTNGVTAQEVPCGKTFWGLRTDGGWGPQVGTQGCTSTYKLPDTGQTTSYTDTFGEDAGLYH